MGKTGSDLVPFIKRCLDLKTYGNVVKYVVGTENAFTINLSRKYKQLDCDSVRFLKEWRQFKDRNLLVQSISEEFNYSTAKQAMVAALRQSVYLGCLNKSKKIYRFLTDKEVTEKKKLKKRKTKNQKGIDYFNPGSVESEGYISSREQLSPSSSIDYDSGLGSPCYAESEPATMLVNINHDHNFYYYKMDESSDIQDTYSIITTLSRPEEPTICLKEENIQQGEISSGNVNPVLESNVLEDVDAQNPDFSFDLDAIDFNSINWDSLLDSKFLESCNFDEVHQEDSVQQPHASSDMQTDFTQNQENFLSFQKALPAAFQNDTMQLQEKDIDLNQEYPLCPTKVSVELLNGPSLQTPKKQRSKIYKYENMIPIGEQILFICEGEEMKTHEENNVDVIACFDEDLHNRLLNMKIQTYVEYGNYLLLILQKQNQCIGGY